MGLSLVFDEGPGSPGMSDGSHDRLPARVDVDVLDTTRCSPPRRSVNESV